jgi:hypothetical protein
MTAKILETAIAEVTSLPEPDQEKIGQELLAHVEKLRALRAEIDKGIRSLDAGQGKKLKMEDVIRRARLNLPSGGAVAVPHAREAHDSCSSDSPRLSGRGS